MSNSHILCNAWLLAYCAKIDCHGRIQPSNNRSWPPEAIKEELKP